MQSKKIISLSLAGIMLLQGSALATETIKSNDGITAVPISVILPHLENVDITVAKEMKSESELVKYNVRIPKVSGLKDVVYQEQLNNNIMSQAMEDIKSVEEQAEEFQKMAKEEGWEVRPYEISIDFDVKSNGGIISFEVNTYTMTGGANGITRLDYYNIDKEQSKEIELKDLFKADADYKSIINEEIASQIKEQMGQENKYYFEDEDGFKTVSDDQKYYIEDGKLVIVFDEYTIAPGYMGSPEFTIPMDSINDMLQNPQLFTGDNTENLIDDVSVFNKMIINNNEVSLNNQMYKNENGVVMIPLRQVAEALGYEVTWNDESKSVELVKGVHWTKLTIGEDNYSFAKMLIKLGTAPETKDGNTYVPLSFTSEVLKAIVSTSDDGTVILEQD